MIFTLDKILELLFPPKCIFCGKLLSAGSEFEICRICFNSIPFYDTSENKRSLKNRDDLYDDVICLCSYSGVIKHSVVKYKFFDKPRYYRTFAGLLAGKIRKMTKFEKFDIIVSVPMHTEKIRSRGYNQSYLISRALSRELGIPEGSHVLQKIMHTRSQSLLDRRQRLSNLKGAFVVKNPAMVKDAVVLLVDDVMTTGSTLNECSRVLKEAGARRVVGAVIAAGRI